MLSSLLLPAVWLHLAGVVVGGASACPTPQAVEGLLAVMVGQQSPGGRAARLMQTERGLLVTLHAPDGTVVAEKQFQGAAACGDLASAAAVVIATWERELQGAADLTLQALPSEPTARIPVAAPLQARFGVAAALTRAGPSLVPGVWVDASVGRQRVHAMAAVFVDGEHERALGVGLAVWQRTGLGVGPRLLWQGERWWLAIDALAYGAYVRLEGRRQPTNVKDDAWDAGATTAARVGWQAGALSPFVSLGISRSFVSRTFAVEPAGEARMPGTQLGLTVGFSWLPKIFSAQ